MMDAIRTYLDNVFMAFPQNETVLAIKRDMLTNMEEKYNALKEEGKSEHEAVGTVIANFGSIDEIAAELGIGQNVAVREEGLKLSREEVNEYITQTRKSSIWIGAAVWLILAGICAMLIIIGFAGGEYDMNRQMGVFALLLTIAATVPIFIVNGLKLSRFEDYDKQNILLDGQTREQLKQKNAEFTPRFSVLISCGVAIVVLAAGACLLIRSMGYEFLAPVLLLFTVGFAVFLFIIAGMKKSAFLILLGKSEYKNKAKNSKSERIIGTIASIYWPLMIVVYMLWSFVFSAWRTSWILWPVAAILFGAIAGGISTWHDTKAH
jgi:hypothetical protein